MLYVNLERKGGAWSIDLTDPYTDWETVTEDFGPLAFRRIGDSVFESLFRRAPDAPTLTKFLDRLAACGMDRTETERIERFIENAPQIVVSNSVLKKDGALSVRMDPQNAAVRGLMKAVKASWFGQSQSWRIPSAHRRETDIVLDAIGRRLSDPWNLPEFDLTLLKEQFPFLQQHQTDNCRFVWESMRGGGHGMLLTDEMGTGKTLSSLAAALQFVERGYAEKVVCVVPSALIERKENWCGDLERFFGIKPQRPGLPKNKVRKRDPDPESSIVSVYSYKSLEKKEVLARAVAEAQDGIVIFDEMHTCSNTQTNAYRNCYMVSQAARYAVGLTGTPVRNDLTELWPIMHILDPNLLPEHEYMRHFVDFEKKEIYVRRRDPSDPRGVLDTIVDQRMFVTDPERLLSRLAPAMIRHERSDVIAKDGRLSVGYRTMRIAMEGRPEFHATKAIESMYSKWMKKFIPDEPMNEFSWEELERLDNPTEPKPSAGRTASLAGAMDKQMGEMISRLVRANDDPGKLLYGTPGSENVTGDALAELLNRENIVSTSYVPRKAQALRSIVAAPERAGKKYVVFCAHTNTAESLAKWLTRTGIGAVAVTGEIVGNKRSVERDRFKNDPDTRVLICTDVLGNGVNIGFADGVIHYSLPWTTSMKDQRDARVLRLDSEGHKEIFTLLSDLYVDIRKSRVQLTKMKFLSMVLDAAKDETKKKESRMGGDDRDMENEPESERSDCGLGGEPENNGAEREPSGESDWLDDLSIG